MDSFIYISFMMIYIQPILYIYLMTNKIILP